MVLADRRQQPADDGRLQRRHFVLRDLARVVDLDAPHLALVQLHRQLAGLERYRHIRRQVAVGLGRDQRGVHRVARRLAPKHSHDLLGDVYGDALLRLRRRGAEVRRDHDLVRLEQRVARQRLLLPDIDRRARDPALVERLLERSFIHDAPARGVDHAGRRLHRPQLRLADEALRTLGERRVHRDVVRLLDQLLHRDDVHAQDARPLLRHERIVRQHPHLESLRPPRHLRPDLPQPDDPQCLAAHLCPLEAPALPLARAQRRVRLRDVPR